MKILILIIYLSKSLASNDILGCGGYIKSDVEIDFSQVGVKLLTQQGNIKYETECAPNNGYYFIPLYDKGDYILKVSPPSGWTFQPEEVPLKIDGETDSCSKGEDINFHFKGFAVIGKVISIGSVSGPAGVTVTLKQGNKIILTTVTSDGGNYVFSPLASGSYSVVASHPSWSFVVDKVDVSVKDQNGDAGNALILNGYELTGHVATNGKSSLKVNLVLMSNKKINHDLGCNVGVPDGFSHTKQKDSLCYTTTNKNGAYSFSNIAPGHYIVVPFLKTNYGVYDILPSEIEAIVQHSDHHITDTFKVIGCSMHGQIITNYPLEVTLDRERTVTTNAKGEFVFPSVKSGKHLIQIKADAVEFDDTTVIFQLDKPTIAPVAPIRFRSCVSVTLDSTNEIKTPWTVDIVEKSGVKYQIETDLSGRGCMFLPKGSYKAFVSISQDAETLGIRFAPKEKLFEVTSSPIEDITFSQFLGEIQGTIICLDSCPPLTVGLRPSKGSSGMARTTISNQGKFYFKDVLPGDYLLSLDKEEWCWVEQTIAIAVNAKKIQAKFEQIGYRLTVNASHRTALNYIANGQPLRTLEVLQGTSRQCISSSGLHVFTPVSCHTFGSNGRFTWDTAAPQLLSLMATHHKVVGNLKSSESGEFMIGVHIDGREDKEEIGPLVSSENDPTIYSFELTLSEGDSVTLIPSSPSKLFQYSPPSYSFKMGRDCLYDVVTFEAERALFLKGFVKPSLKGVTIKVNSENTVETFSTNAEGLFIAGPLNKFKHYTVTAEKVGYVISPPQIKVDARAQHTAGVIKVNFDAYKLAEVIVKVLDTSESPLKGVLISISGGKNYRQNSLTDEEGLIGFQSLIPSDYFLRPMMKEYVFDPSSKMVQVEDGGTVHVDVRARRVAYSIFGQTVSLSGESEADVVVEALGIEEKCSQLQEEAVSDTQGNFRIRGLIPHCNYKLRLMKGDGINPHVTQTIPKESIVHIDENDILHKKLVVLRNFLQMDVAVIVDTEPQFLQTLTAELYRDDQPDSVLHIFSVGNHPFFMLPPMIADRASYTLQIVSSLPQAQYTYKHPLIPFIANNSFKKLSVSFNPTLNSRDAEISHSTIFGLFFFIFMIILGVNYRKLLPILQDIYNSVKNSRASQGSESFGAKKRVKSRKT